MNTYRVSYRQLEYRSTSVEAATADDAVAMVLAGDFDDSDFDMAENTEVLGTEVES